MAIVVREDRKTFRIVENGTVHTVTVPTGITFFQGTRKFVICRVVHPDYPDNRHFHVKDYSSAKAALYDCINSLLGALGDDAMVIRKLERKPRNKDYDAPVGVCVRTCENGTVEVAATHPLRTGKTCFYLPASTVARDLEKAIQQASRIREEYEAEFIRERTYAG